MRKKNSTLFCSICFCIVILLLTGCISNKNVKEAREVGRYSITDFANQPVELPGNYNTENFRKLLMGVSCSKANIVDNTTVGSSEYLKSHISEGLESEMAKLKRFTVFSIHNNGGFDEIRQLSDIGEAKLPENNIKELDLVMTCSTTITKQCFNERYNYLLDYTVDLNCSVVDTRTSECVFQETVSGRAYRKIYIGANGQIIGGFSGNDETQIVIEAIRKALKHLNIKLGNRYPVGGSITGCKGNRMAINKGFEHGLDKDMVLVVYVNDKATGIDIPLAYAVATPGRFNGNLEVKKWADNDQDAKQLIQQLKTDPEFCKKNSVYAVSKGLAELAEWDKK